MDSRPLTGWGTVLADLDLDGHLDLAATNGHIRREPAQLYPYENPPIVWRNNGSGRFVNVNLGAAWGVFPGTAHGSRAGVRRPRR